ncbi:Mutator protein MutT [Legionella rubrilucens]|uniref:8-oxo-dGTP diphosphatase n=1 Tax=Legionella rubrilucens TaxID=458 RepID=A0A0W0XPS2_9GAMM|nr:NUDIX domain-containing protein [Legionella rubrilucens]KTD46604.1 Mutator protein MutT [Legionella rubrilucens]
MIHVVMGFVINQKGHILIEQRGEYQYESVAWELPGGKVEPGETALVALRREFEEELSIEIVQAKPLLQIPYDSQDRKMLLDIWLIEQFSGQITGLEGQSLRWVNKDEFIAFFGLAKTDNETDKILDDLLKNRTRCIQDKNF